MDALDGNAIGGLLIDVFGADMTAAESVCGNCGASRPVAELVVYRRAPGTVVRCRTCDSILMVFVTNHSMTGVDLSGLASLSEPGSALSGRPDSGALPKRAPPDKEHGRDKHVNPVSPIKAGAAPSPDDARRSSLRPDERSPELHHPL
jgi:hypothetical protein